MRRGSPVPAERVLERHVGIRVDGVCVQRNKHLDVPELTREVEPPLAATGADDLLDALAAEKPSDALRLAGILLNLLVQPLLFGADAHGVADGRDAPRGQRLALAVVVILQHGPDAGRDVFLAFKDVDEHVSEGCADLIVGIFVGLATPKRRDPVAGCGHDHVFALPDAVNRLRIVAIHLGAGELLERAKRCIVIKIYPHWNLLCFSGKLKLSLPCSVGHYSPADHRH